MPDYNAEPADLPEPMLTYHYWGRQTVDLDVVTPDTVRLYSLNEAHVSRDPDGSMYAYLRGAVRKRDGERGRQARSVIVKPHPDQPLWLALLFADAGRRLGVRLPPESRTPDVTP